MIHAVNKLLAGGSAYAYEVVNKSRQEAYPFLINLMLWSSVNVCF
jgi:hypothetical protein